MILRSLLLVLLCALTLHASEPSRPGAVVAAVPADVAVALAVPPHAFNQSYIYLRIYEDRIEGKLEINLGDLNRALGTTFRTDLEATEAEVGAEIEKVRDYLFGRVSIALEGKQLEMRPGEFALYESAANQFVSIKFDLLGVDGTPEALEVTHRVMFDVDPDHRGFLVIEHWFKQGLFQNEGQVSLAFDPGSTTQTLDLTDASIWRGVLSLMKLGMHHIWEGIDHVLFLLVLLLPSVLRRREDGKWEPVDSFKTALWQVFKIVTVFTIAHSITLSLSALEIVSLPARIVESIIALSIAVAAVDVLFPIFKGKILWVVLGFGLFHGFGFAFLLGEMGISGSNMVYSLLGFNGGVEVGQLAIVLAVFPLLFMMRLSLLYTRFFVYAGAVAAMFVALYWFVERAFEVDLPLGEYLAPVLKYL